MRRLAPLAFLGALLLAGGARAGQESGEATERSPRRVLLVGNSYSRFNDLPDTLQAMAGTVPDGPPVTVDIAFRAGSSLRTHWERGMAARMLHAGRYTHVVLQDHSRAVFDRPEELGDYAGRFAREAEQAGARTVLFATWARHPANALYARGRDARTPDEMQERIDAMYAAAAARVGAHVVPVGRAWMLARVRWPHIRLHRPDGSHPNRAGSFLTACVLYGAVTGVSPEAIAHGPHRVAAPTQARLRSVAAEALGFEVQEFLESTSQE
jgi:hypothetical protein